MRLLSLPRYGPAGASSRVRFRQYYRALRENLGNLDITELPLLDDDYLRRKYSRVTTAGAVLRCYARRLARLSATGDSELRWVEKELFPWVPAWVERLLLRPPYVLDLDDAIFHNYDLHPQRLVRSVYSRKIDELMARASLVVAGNEYLAQRARAAGAPWVEVLPTVIDLDRYPFPAVDRGAGRAEEITLGWIGSPATSHYLAQLAEPLARLSVRRRFRLRVIGAGPVAMPGVAVEVVDWSEDTEVDALRGLDIGVMPLPDSPWERGKCGYKLIQYMACGIPVVASPIGVNRTIVRDGENGFLAGDADAWLEAIDRLCGDAALRTRLGAEGRRRVEAEYCVQVTAPRLAGWLRAAGARRGA